MLRFHSGEATFDLICVEPVRAAEQKQQNADLYGVVVISKYGPSAPFIFDKSPVMEVCCVIFVQQSSQDTSFVSRVQVFDIVPYCTYTQPYSVMEDSYLLESPRSVY